MEDVTFVPGSYINRNIYVYCLYCGLYCQIIYRSLNKQLENDDLKYPQSITKIHSYTHIRLCPNY